MSEKAKRVREDALLLIAEMLSEVSRVEVIDHTTSAKTVGRVFTKWAHKDDMDVSLSFQDNARTLKVFLQDKPTK